MVRARAAEAIATLGQKRSDWTDDRLLELLQDNLSDWRQTAGLVLANREILAFRTYDKVMPFGMIRALGCALRPGTPFWKLRKSVRHGSAKPGRPSPQSLQNSRVGFQRIAYTCPWFVIARA